MIDTSIEQVIPLSVAARETPNRRGTNGVNAATTWRWALRGVKGIRLETVWIGGQRMTSREAMGRFFSAITAAVDGTPVPTVVTSKQRQRQIAAAERELTLAGIGRSRNAKRKSEDSGSTLVKTRPTSERGEQ